MVLEKSQGGELHGHQGHERDMRDTGATRLSEVVVPMGLPLGTLGCWEQGMGNTGCPPASPSAVLGQNGAVGGLGLLCVPHPEQLCEDMKGNWGEELGLAPYSK